MTGLDDSDVVDAVGVAIANTQVEHCIDGVAPDDYMIDNTSSRAVNFILSTAHRYKSWAGIRD